MTKGKATVTVTVERYSEETVKGGFFGLQDVPSWDSWCARVEVLGLNPPFPSMDFYASTEAKAVAKADKYVENMIREANKPEPKLVRKLEIDL